MGIFSKPGIESGVKREVCSIGQVRGFFLWHLQFSFRALVFCEAIPGLYYTGELHRQDEVLAVPAIECGVWEIREVSTKCESPKLVAAFGLGRLPRIVFDHFPFVGSQSIDYHLLVG